MLCKGKGSYVDSDGKEFFLKGKFIFPDMEFQCLNCKGKFKFVRLKSDDVCLKGEIEGELLTGVEIYLKGKVKLKDLIGEDIKLELSRENIINSIECNRLLICAVNSEEDIEIIKDLFNINLKRNINEKETRIAIDKIIADDVDLYGCDVREIVCRNIKARSCTIERLVYTDTCDII